MLEKCSNKRREISKWDTQSTQKSICRLEKFYFCFMTAVIFKLCYTHDPWLPYVIWNLISLSILRKLKKKLFVSLLHMIIASLNEFKREQFSCFITIRQWKVYKTLVYVATSVKVTIDEKNLDTGGWGKRLDNDI